MSTPTFKTKDGERTLTRDEVLEGMMKFDQDYRPNGAPETGNGWFIQEKDQKYPPKYVVWLGTGVPRGQFKGGGRVNNALRSLGFDVREVEDPREEPDADEAEEIETATFSIERDLQNALRKHIEQLEQGLHITDSGKEQVVDSGRIDITAKDKKGATVVIELKAGEADHHAIGQILAYMGELMTDKDITRGILVAGGFSQKALAAVRVVKNLQLKKYGFNFTFEDAGKS